MLIKLFNSTMKYSKNSPINSTKNSDIKASSQDSKSKKWNQYSL